MAEEIFEIRTSCEDNRPFDVDHRFTDGLDDDSSLNYSIIQGDSMVDPATWRPWEFYCAEPGTDRVTDWDYYDLSGTAGLFSVRAIRVLQPYLDPSFTVLPALLDGNEFYFVAIRNRLDCLSRSKSEILFFDDGTVRHIDRYVFQKSRVRDPLVFAIPEEIATLFATESVVEASTAEGLMGFDYRLVDGRG